MDLGLAVLVLPLLVALAITTVRSAAGDAVMLVAALCLAVVWLRVDSLFEGPVLVRFSEDHGLVVADLFGLAVAVAAGAGWLLAHRRRAVALDSSLR